MKRKCCCTSYEGTANCSNDCNCPEDGCVHRLLIYVDNVKPDAAGKGIVWFDAGSQICADCLADTCERVPLSAYGLYCDPCTETFCCDHVQDAEAPSVDGSAHWEWSYCGETDDPDIRNDQEGCVTVHWVQRVNGPGALCADWDFGLCHTVVYVTFQYSTSFPFPSYEEDDPDSLSTDWHNFTAAWDCIYSRKNRPNEPVALGPYTLIWCSYPAAHKTLNQACSVNNSAQWCTLDGGEVCASGPTHPARVPTLWKPPSYITVSRTR